MATKKLVKGYTVASVVKTTDGSLSFLDRIKSWYVTGIAFVGTVLVVLNQLTPVLDFIPAAKSTVTTVIAIVTGLLAVLKQNEQWVEDL